MQPRTRLVRMSRTPQLMSKPTPPGDTTAWGSAMSNAATLPMAKPYPECMSGRAMDLCTRTALPLHAARSMVDSRVRLLHGRCQPYRGT